MKVVVLYPVDVVGMWHQAKVADLGITKSYSLKREPSNSNDRNAFAVMDGEKRMGYLKWEDAELISPIVDENRETIRKLWFKASEVSRPSKRGPMQKGQIAFYIEESDEIRMKTLFPSRFMLSVKKTN
ncbi:unnamed protein product [Owenia fusiformis]|uniref:HIRAN domain-containing protein n=1 Tax=Owenia fusiformis TaxID=6347 RepID=A0A8J1UYU9_OWEFU|nr:unnamed protein product [Owenia fusiformis]